MMASISVSRMALRCCAEAGRAATASATKAAAAPTKRAACLDSRFMAYSRRSPPPRSSQSNHGLSAAPPSALGLLGRRDDLGRVLGDEGGDVDLGGRTGGGRRGQFRRFLDRLGRGLFR